MFAHLLSLGLVLLPTALAATYDVEVGFNGTLTFHPEAIGANVGDVVKFTFTSKNHTATQSSFANPCGKKEGGFNSGFQPVAANQKDDFPTYSITVKDTEPIWMYCAQALNTANSHCGKGMVFAINCGADGAPNSFTNFKNSALEIGKKLAAESPADTAAPPSGTAAAPSYTTAAYGGLTIPAAPSATLVTKVITLSTSTWTTTYSSYPNAPEPTPTSLEGEVHRVIVGGDKGLVFDPQSVVAKPRDTIIFEFHQKNHTVTQSSFDDPCRRLNKDGVLGFDSDFFPVGADLTSGFPTWNYTVTDTAPVWAYCRQKTPASHCGAGMVFAINSDESSPRNFAAYKNVAETLNGTAVGAQTPAATGTQTGGALSIQTSGLGVALTISLGLVASILL